MLFCYFLGDFYIDLILGAWMNECRILLKGTDPRAEGNPALRKGLIHARKGISSPERDYSTRERESSSKKGTDPRAKGNLARRKGLIRARKGILLSKRD